MTTRIANIRPVIYWNGNDGHWQCDTEVIGTNADWDWLFAELNGKVITSIKLIRQLNPGIGLRDAKDAYDAANAYRNRGMNRAS